MLDPYGTPMPNPDTHAPPKTPKAPKRPFSYWPTTVTPICGFPRWAVGRYGPRMIIQTDDEATVQRVVDALNAHDKENGNA